MMRLAQLRDAQFERAAACFPVAVPVAVAMDQPVRRALAMAGAGQRLDLKLHQPLRGKADHLAKQIGVGVVCQSRAKLHHIVGHRRVLGLGCLVWRPNLTGDQRWPPLWITGPPPPDSWRSLRRAGYPQLLHHAAGHDRSTRSAHHPANEDWQRKSGLTPPAEQKPNRSRLRRLVGEGELAKQWMAAEERPAADIGD